LEFAKNYTKEEIQKSVDIMKNKNKNLIQINKTTNKYAIIEITNNLVSEGKEARFQTATPYIESGKTQLIKLPCMDELIKQFIGYPKVKHDEAIDLLGYASNHYFKPTSLANSTMIGAENLY
jgi:predicted phage terminase large subunit-like protein